MPTGSTMEEWYCNSERDNVGRLTADGIKLQIHKKIFKDRLHEYNTIYAKLDKERKSVV